MNPIPPLLACVPDDAEVRRRIGEVLGGGYVCEPYPGSTAAECVSCGCKVSVNPMQRAAHGRYPQAQIMCLPCALPEVVFGAPVLALTAKEWLRKAAS